MESASMVLVKLLSKMETDTLVNFIMDFFQAKANLYGQTVSHMKVNLLIIVSQEKEYIPGLMDPHIKDKLEMGFEMVMESIKLMMLLIKVNGNKVKNKVKVK